MRDVMAVGHSSMDTLLKMVIWLMSNVLHIWEKLKERHVANTNNANQLPQSKTAFS